MLVSVPAALLANPGPQSELLQFKQAGHVVGFESRGVYVASGDHLLRLTFEAPNDVSPQISGSTEKQSETDSLVKVTYSNLWNGIDLQYTTTENGIIESTWQLASMAKVENILLRYNAPVSIATDGSLKIHYQNGWMRSSAPIAWQDIQGRRIPVDVNFVLPAYAENAQPLVGFSLGAYASQYPVKIDPVLSWNTSLGANGVNTRDIAGAITVDSAGNTYVTGESATSWGTPVVAHAGGLSNIFVAKLSPSGNVLWNTFLGGSSGADYGEGVALDAAGNIYITGYGYNGSWGAPLASGGGGIDILVAKLNNDGVRQWHTFYGGSSGDIPSSIAVAGSSVYVTGNTYLNTWGTPITAHAGKQDIFVLKLNTAGAFQWNTFVGSAGYEFGGDIALDDAENVYVTGNADRNWGSPVNAHTSGAFNQRDIVVVKLNAAGAYQWHTFHGTLENDVGSAIFVEGDGSNVYLAGLSDQSSAMPEPDWMADALNSHAGGEDAFVAKLDSAGALVWHTFMGTAGGGDGARGVAVDADGNVYVAGYTEGSWGIPLAPYQSGKDVFVAVFDSNGSALRHTYAGTPYYDLTTDLALDSNNNLYVLGDENIPLGSKESDSNVFVMKFTNAVDNPCSFFIIPGNQNLVTLCL